jgi:hypothetical protein
MGSPKRSPTKVAITAIEATITVQQTCRRLVLLLGGGPIAQTDSLRSPRSDILPAPKRPSLKSRSGIYLCGYPRRSKKIVEVAEEFPLPIPPCLSLPLSTCRRALKSGLLIFPRAIFNASRFVSALDCGHLCRIGLRRVFAVEPVGIWQTRLRQTRL